MYTFVAGKIQYGEITTDAAYTYVRLAKGQLIYALIDGMKLIYNEKTVFSSDEPSVYDLSHRPDIDRNGIFTTKRDYWEYELKTKWDSWEDTISI
jgi:hypothetical protein